MSAFTVRQLECFVALADRLNFRMAAEACFITQPALSAQIRQLETALGTKLFERDRRKVLATAAGAAMTARAQKILADLHDLEDFARSFEEPLSGTLRLGVIPTVAPYVLPGAMGRIRRRYPHLRLLLHEAQTEQLVSMLEEGKLDLLLLALESELGGAETMTLWTDPFVLAVPLGHRLAKRKKASEKDLDGEQVLLLDDGHCLRDQALALCDTAGACEIGDFRASSLTTLVQMVASGVGITLLPEMSLEVEAEISRRLGLIPFGAGGWSRTIGLAWRSSSLRREEFELLGAAIGESRVDRRG